MSTEPQTQAISTSRLNPQLVDVFCRLVEMGNYYKACCSVVGISYEAFNLWMRYGRAATSDDDPYRQFYLRVQQANGLAESHAVKMWQSHFAMDYRAIRDFLARRFPERWGSRHFVTMAVDKELEKMMGLLHQSLAPAEYAKVVRVLAGGGSSSESDETIDIDSLLDEEAAFSFELAEPIEYRVGEDVSGTTSSD